MWGVWYYSHMSPHERKVHIYIRKSDWDKWKVIKNKPEWLHLVINTAPPILSFAADMTHENKRLDYLKKHPEERKELTGLDFLYEPKYEPMEPTA